jgi:hypothetical protein
VVAPTGQLYSELYMHLRGGVSVLQVLVAAHRAPTKSGSDHQHLAHQIVDLAATVKEIRSREELPRS